VVRLGDKDHSDLWWNSHFAHVLSDFFSMLFKLFSFQSERGVTSAADSIAVPNEADSTFQISIFLET